ncbi:uncharacterized protein KZ484_010535 isoform 1-T1 [Pholidichthys leucotaenia]
MKLLLSSLLLASLCTLSSWSVSSSELAVTQTRHLSVKKGETINITCCWSENFTRTRVSWIKNYTVIQKSIHFQNEDSPNRNCSTLTLVNITHSNSGRYICEVSAEIPILSQVNGSGTVITVVDEDNTDFLSAPHFPVIILAAVVPLLLIALTCFCILQRKRAVAARVIYEVPHVDSEVSDIDKHSTSSSRGSSEWCQVPVYDSFYFQHVDPKESE